MAIVSMKDLLEAGVHFGHQARRWDPKMAPFIFTKRKGLHIINLLKTVEYAEKAYNFIKDLTASGGFVLFVGTKKQARSAVENAAKGCGMPYVTLRWPGGLLTNFRTIRNSIERLNKIEKILKDEIELTTLTKKERLQLAREKEKLEAVFSGIRDMTRLPDVLFVVDIKKEEIAVKEARKLGIAVVGIVDTNGDPTVVEYPIPGNDDAIRSIILLSELIANAVKEGKKKLQMKKEGEDITAQSEHKEEIVSADTDDKIKEKYKDFELGDGARKIAGITQIEDGAGEESKDKNEEKESEKEASGGEEISESKEEH